MLRQRETPGQDEESLASEIVPAAASCPGQVEILSLTSPHPGC